MRDFLFGLLLILAALAWHLWPRLTQFFDVRNPPVPKGFEVPPPRRDQGSLTDRLAQLHAQEIEEARHAR